jgi:hypothetical protein
MSLSNFLIGLLLQVSCCVLGPLGDISVYSSTESSCEQDLYIDRDVLGVRTRSRGKIDCMRQCASNMECAVAMYQEFQGGLAYCSKLSTARDDPSSTIDVSTSTLCVAFLVRVCFNSGQLYRCVCVCQDGFAGKLL